VAAHLQEPAEDSKSDLIGSVDAGCSKDLLLVSDVDALALLWRSLVERPPPLFGSPEAVGRWITKRQERQRDIETELP